MAKQPETERLLSNDPKQIRSAHHTAGRSESWGHDKSQNKVTQAHSHLLDPIPLWCYGVAIFCAAVNGLQMGVLSLDFMAGFTSFSVAATCAAASLVCNMLTLGMGASEALYNLTNHYQNLFKKPGAVQTMVANVSTCLLFFLCGYNSWINTYAILGIAVNTTTVSIAVGLSLCCALANLILLSADLVQPSPATPQQAKPISTSGKVASSILAPVQSAALAFVLYLSGMEVMTALIPQPEWHAAIMASQVFLSACCMVSMYLFYRERTAQVVSDNDFKAIMSEPKTRIQAVIGFVLVTLNAVANAFMVASGNAITKVARLAVVAPAGLITSLLVNMRSLKDGLALSKNFNDPAFASERIKTWPLKWHRRQTTLEVSTQLDPSNEQKLKSA